MSGFERVRTALSAPIRFATESRGARVARLRGFSALCRAQLALCDKDPPGDAITPPLRAALEAAAAGFDAGDAETRLALLRPLYVHLGMSQRAAPSGTQAHKRTRAPRSTQTGQARQTGQTVQPRQPERPPVQDARVADSAKPLRPHDALLTLDGVGPSRAAGLEKAGLATVSDLLSLAPRAFEDRRTLTPIRTLSIGQYAVVAGVIQRAGASGFGRGRRFEVVIDDGTGLLSLVFFQFQQHALTSRFVVGEPLAAAGTPAAYGKRTQMVHPKTARGSGDALLTGWSPVYSDVAGNKGGFVRKLVHQAFSRLAGPVEDPIPAALVRGANVPTLEDAWQLLHAPPADAEPEVSLERARRRFAYQEFLAFQLVMEERRRGATREAGHTLPLMDVEALSDEVLPFAPTPAQTRVTREISADMHSGAPMTRLLQGDVGAGKTAVAALSALHVMQNGGQVALLAPTEILAEQHMATMRGFLGETGFRMALFSGALKPKERKLLAARIANHDVQLVVGTHALLGKDVCFRRLQLAIVDEQHRFGVKQRAQLRQQSAPDADRAPHMLIMTATPIPRTLAMTLYGDLHVSVLDTLPPGRTPVQTVHHSLTARKRAFDAAAEAIARDERVYVVVPLVDESDALNLTHVEAARAMWAEALPEAAVGTLHGRMQNTEKEQAMRAFKTGRTQVLVATTVVEVGVDVPDATLMVIEHAERFGLSQLHQLRGRVGRGARESRCMLLSGTPLSADARARIDAMVRTTDGFEIAAADLSIRGPGDFIGTRQSGAPLFAFADLVKDADLAERARDDARALRATDPKLEQHAGLAALADARGASLAALLEA